ncbi:hypothetical protein [Rhizohabitans arisaemae]|uniref:hypothetical protein n=1 Tax=Rhizohabitans arisaemae TaxID=2720610 RepID=UPI0024B27C15|nr:hypothetical protein [Rhizohabitans arisaemae]
MGFPFTGPAHEAEEVEDPRRGRRSGRLVGDLSGSDSTRWRFGFFVVLAGLIVVLISFVAAVVVNSEMAVLFAGVAGVTGTIIGAYFGVLTGQSGKEQVEAELRRMNEVAVRMAAHVPTAQAESVINAVMGRVNSRP